MSPSMSRAAVWWSALRPATLWAAVAPVVVGTACAHALGGVVWPPALAALLGAILIQIGTNFANDVQDFERGADTDERLGPTRAVQAGWVSRRAMWIATLVTFGLAVLCGIYLVWVGGWVILVIGITAVASGLAYTGGPFPLGYHGLGDVFVLIFFGFAAVVGTVYVQLATAPMLAWWCGLGVGSLATAILVVNNLRDIDTDLKAGKRTLAVRFGPRFARWEYGLLCVAALVVPLVLVLGFGYGLILLLPCVLAPLALLLTVQISRTSGVALNPLLGRTARLLLLYSVLLAGSLLLVR